MHHIQQRLFWTFVYGALLLLQAFNFQTPKEMLQQLLLLLIGFLAPFMIEVNTQTTLATVYPAVLYDFALAEAVKFSPMLLGSLLLLSKSWNFEPVMLNLLISTSSSVSSASLCPPSVCLSHAVIVFIKNLVMSLAASALTTFFRTYSSQAVFQLTLFEANPTTFF